MLSARKGVIEGDCIASVVFGGWCGWCLVWNCQQSADRSFLDPKQQNLGIVQVHWSTSVYFFTTFLLLLAFFPMAQLAIVVVFFAALVEVPFPATSPFPVSVVLESCPGRIIVAA